MVVRGLSYNVVVLLAGLLLWLLRWRILTVGGVMVGGSTFGMIRTLIGRLLMTKEVGVSEILDMDDMIVSAQGYTRKQLSDAFDSIADPSNWKLPITGIVKLDELDLYNEACLFFTGGCLTVEYIQGDRAAVSGAGYYEVIGC